MTTPATTIPNMTKLTRALLTLLVAGAATVASAQESRPPAQPSEQRANDQRQGEQRQADAHESVLRLLPADSVSEHAVAIPGGTLVYTATAGTFSLPSAGGRFALASLGGVAIGIAVGYVIAALRRRLDDPATEISISLVTAYLAYLPASAVGASGVLGRPADPRVFR